MSLYFALASDGSFTVGDSDTGLACYAFSGSSYGNLEEEDE